MEFGIGIYMVRIAKWTKIYITFSRICMSEISGKISPVNRHSDGAYNHSSGNRISALRFLCIASVVLALLAVSPVMAGTKFMTGSPDLSASIAGTNEFSPGDDVNLQVVIGNTGLNQYKIIQSGIIDPSDLSSTAKQLTVALGASDTPIVIKADPQVVGDLLASTTATATFHIKVNQDAPAGTYQVPVVLNYTYLYQAEQEGTDTLNYQYKIGKREHHPPDQDKIRSADRGSRR